MSVLVGAGAKYSSPGIIRPDTSQEHRMKRFENKVVVVTGGGGGIGSATARRFAGEGAKVAVLDRDLAAATRVAQAIGASGGEAIAGLCDISRRDSVDAAVAKVCSQWETIDVLVNNAGWDVF